MKGLLDLDLAGCDLFAEREKVPVPAKSGGMMCHGSGVDTVKAAWGRWDSFRDVCVRRRQWDFSCSF